MHSVSGIELFRLEELLCGNHGDLHHARGGGGGCRGEDGSPFHAHVNEPHL